ncbi:hypothetical protein DPMN_185530 [Dreissena polymorpha]|uniref:Uncharacterized protein n=1 Tax=Dreissena polymorpha TaxID=45954 RepID=A0A9D4DM29_DREPO|nr:hypothetical protein DPMN_185530 [Dreissena polymorpha]
MLVVIVFVVRFITNNRTQVNIFVNLFHLFNASADPCLYVFWFRQCKMEILQLISICTSSRTDADKNVYSSLKVHHHKLMLILTCTVSRRYIITHCVQFLAASQTEADMNVYISSQFLADTSSQTDADMEVYSSSQVHHHKLMLI